MANNVLIQSSQIREQSSGQLGPFSFKAAAGKIFSGPPNVFTEGSEWDGLNNAILLVDDSATDYAITDRSGNGIYGTQTFKVSLRYDIGDIACGAEPQNLATIDFPTTTIGRTCVEKTGNIFFNSQYTGGDMPIFSNYIFPRQIPTGQYIGESGASYSYAALNTHTYSFFVTAETNALTFYSSTLINGGAAFSISGQFSKTVSVSTSVYTGSIDIYWGTITLTVNGDFVNASMIFDNGLRGTENWIVWDDKCWVVPATRRNGYTDSIRSIVKTNSCEFTGGNDRPIFETQTNLNSSVYHIMKSGTDAYSWGHVNQSRQASFGSRGAGVRDIYEPYGWSKDDGGNGTIITIYSNGVMRRSVDRGKTFSSVTHNDATWSSAIGTYARRMEDVAFAGVNSSGNKVWYGVGFTIDTTQYMQQFMQAYLMISEDDGATWDMADVYLDSNGKQADFYKPATKYGTVGTSQRLFRLHASLKYNYVFIETMNMQHDNSTWRQLVLFKYHPSQTGSTNVQARIAPVAQYIRQSLTPVSWDYANTYTADDYDASIGNVNNYTNSENSLAFAINPATGFCVYLQQEMYMVSWNYGLNWTVDKNMLGNISTTKLHPTANVTLIYPEKFPSIVFFDGNFLINTSVNYGETSNSTSYRNFNNLPSYAGAISGDRIVDGLMQPIIKQNNLVTGTYINDFSTTVSYGGYPSLPSSAFGPYNQIWSTPSPVAYGNGKAYIFVNYQTDLDPSYVNQYWFTYDFKNDTLLAQQNTSGTGWGFFSRQITPHGNDLYFSPDPNSPTVTTRNTLYKSTDDMLTTSLVHTFPQSNRYIYFVCEYDGSSNNFLAVQRSDGSDLFYSTDASTYQTVSNLSNIGGGLSWNSATNSKTFFAGGNCSIENGYMYLLDDTRTSYNGTLGRSYVIPVSEIADASTWSNYEVTSQFLNDVNSYYGINQLFVIGSNAILRYTYPPSSGTPRPIYYSTNNGSTWTRLTASITDTSGNTWTLDELDDFGQISKNHDGGQFFFYQANANSNKNGTNTTYDWHRLLWTKDFSTWNYAEWSAEDANNDSYSQDTFGLVVGNGDLEDLLYVHRQNTYTQSIRKVDLSASAIPSVPQLTDFIDTWDIIKDYEYIPAAQVTSNANGTLGFFTPDYYIDETSNSGGPRLLINHVYSVFTYPAPDAPLVANEPNDEIIPPVFTDVTNLSYAPASQQYRYRAQSDQPFSIVWTKANGSLMQFDGVFDIIVYSLSEPVIIEGFVNQDINVVTNQLVNRFQSEPSQFEANSAQLVYYNREIFGFEVHQITSGGTFQGVTWNATIDDNYRSWLTQHSTYYLRHSNDRADVAKSSTSGKLFREQVTYENNFAIEVPQGYDMDNQGPGFQPTNPYGNYLLFFPPQDNQTVTTPGPFMDIIGMKWYADLKGTKYADGYYWYENLIEYDVGAVSRDGTSWYMTFGNVDDNTYIYIKNGFVNEIGNAKDLPNYDRC